MEQQCQDGCQTDQIVALDCVEFAIVTGSENHHYVVKYVTCQNCGKKFLNLEDKVPSLIVGEVALLGMKNTLKTQNSMQRTPKTIVQQMNVYRERPVTDRLFRILMTMSANPKVCTVPARVKMKENCPLLNCRQMNITMAARIPQEMRASFLMYFMIL